MNEIQYVTDVRTLYRTFLNSALAALREPDPTGYDQRLVLLDTLEEALCDLRERWENDEDEDDWTTANRTRAHTETDRRIR